MLGGNPVKANSFAYIYDCRTMGRVSDSVKVLLSFKIAGRWVGSQTL